MKDDGQGTANITEKRLFYFLSEETLQLYYDIYMEFKSKYPKVIENKPLGENDVIVQVNIDKCMDPSHTSEESRASVLLYNLWSIFLS